MSPITQNPFSGARLAQPDGFVNPMDEPARFLDLLFDWQNLGHVAQIVGPHGCGKSTLAMALGLAGGATSIQHRVVHWPTTRIGASDLPVSLVDDRTVTPTMGFRDSVQSLVSWDAQEMNRNDSVSDLPLTMVPQEVWIVDGLTHWHPFHAWMIRRTCRRAGIGVLFTSHAPIRGIPSLVRLKPSFAHFRKVVAVMLGSADQPWETGDVRKLYRANQRNYRDAMMDLFDLYERGRSRGWARAERRASG